MSLLKRIGAYADNADPRAAACNAVALIVVSNQPFYPWFVKWAVGGPWQSAFWTWLSTPVFLAVPWVARRSSMAGRSLLLLAGAGNTLMSAKAFGAGSGVALFLPAIAMIAGMAFRRRERLVLLAMLGVLFVVFALLTLHGGPVAMAAFTAAQYGHFLNLNAWSVACLIGFVALRFSGLEEGAQS